MKLVVGLGNPGEEFHGTRHNLGFMVVEELARRYRVKKQEYKHSAVLGWIDCRGGQVILAKPLTYMNKSGLAVNELVKRFQPASDEILIVYDDLDLEPGRIRLRARGGPGGHRGIQSIIGSLGTQEFHRLRVGIGRPPGGEDAVDYVLARFRLEEQETIATAVKMAADAVEVWVKEGIVKAMNRYN